ncbi:hypothetical protein KA005_15980 [bacterium]|nr:hypothetical protein [bacterium]
MNKVSEQDVKNTIFGMLQKIDSGVRPEEVVFEMVLIVSDYKVPSQWWWHVINLCKYAEATPTVNALLASILQDHKNNGPLLQYIADDMSEDIRIEFGLPRQKHLPALDFLLKCLHSENRDIISLAQVLVLRHLYPTKRPKEPADASAWIDFIKNVIDQGAIG